MAEECQVLYKNVHFRGHLNENKARPWLHGVTKVLL